MSDRSESRAKAIACELTGGHHMELQYPINPDSFSNSACTRCGLHETIVWVLEFEKAWERVRLDEEARLKRVAQEGSGFESLVLR